MSFAIYLIFLVSTYLRPFEAFWPELSVYRPMLALSLLTLVVVIGAVLLMRQKIAARSTHFLLLGAFVLVIVMSLLFNGMGSGLAITAVSEFSFSVIMFCVTVMCVNSLSRLRTACVVFALTMTLLAVAGIVSYYTGFMVDELVLRQNTDVADEDAAFDPDATPAQDDSGLYFWRVRSLGFLGDPNDFAQMLVVALPLLFALMQPGRWIRNAVFVGLPAAAVGWAIYLTHSRGALVALAAVAFMGVRRWLGTIGSGLLVALAGGAALLANAAGGRGFSGKEESAAGRIDAWGEGFNMFRSSPLLGIGYGHFEDFNDLTAHNSYVLCLAELGFIGYYVWLALIVLTMMELAEVPGRADAADAQRLWARAIGLSCVGFLVAAWFLSRTYQPCLYTVLGLAVAAANLPRAAAPAPRPAAPTGPAWMKRTWLVCIVLFVAIYVTVTMQHL